MIGWAPLIPTFFAFKLHPKSCPNAVVNFSRLHILIKWDDKFRRTCPAKMQESMPCSFSSSVTSKVVYYIELTVH